MAKVLTPEELVEFARLRDRAIAQGASAFQFLGRWWVLDTNGEITYSYPEPEGQTHEAIANMRVLWPTMVKLLQQPHVQQSLLDEGKKINWDAVNEIERQCGLPQTPCPDSLATQKLGLKKTAS